ncbi:hypothetical protein O3P69_007452 [Scylla paramamosain]|uniref:Uncharacterized protein n=1 Tax=Scylla paramamosain TaxID=85552 RepID=A0AAW0V7B7_SCYPA
MKICISNLRQPLPAHLLMTVGRLEPLPVPVFIVVGDLFCDVNPSRVFPTHSLQTLENGRLLHNPEEDIAWQSLSPPPLPPRMEVWKENKDYEGSTLTLQGWLLTGCDINTLHVWYVQELAEGQGDRAHSLTIPAHHAPDKSVTWHAFSFVFLKVNRATPPISPSPLDPTQSPLPPHSYTRQTPTPVLSPHPSPITATILGSNEVILTPSERGQRHACPGHVDVLQTKSAPSTCLVGRDDAASFALILPFVPHEWFLGKTEQDSG